MIEWRMRDGRSLLAFRFVTKRQAYVSVKQGDGTSHHFPSSVCEGKRAMVACLLFMSHQRDLLS